MFTNTEILANVLNVVYTMPLQDIPSNFTGNDNVSGSILLLIVGILWGFYFFYYRVYKKD